jgi:hypothetical protein
MPEPSPIAIPTPQVALTPPPNALAPASAPMVTPSPIAIPSAFEQTNVYTFGSPPSNNYAAPSAAAQIFYAQVQPTVVADGQSLTISAITTTNVVKVVFGLSPVIPEAHLTQLSPGKWQAIFPFSAAALPSTQGPVQMTLTASSAMGATVSVPIPISVLRP